jgi:hypothetical protein
MPWQRKRKAAKVVVKKLFTKAKEVEAAPVPKPEPVVEPVVPDGPRCECGKPVAEGQTSVCKDHIRSK